MVVEVIVVATDVVVVGTVVEVVVGIVPPEEQTYWLYKSFSGVSMSHIMSSSSFIFPVHRLFIFTLQPISFQSLYSYSRPEHCCVSHFSPN